MHAHESRLIQYHPQCQQGTVVCNERTAHICDTVPASISQAGAFEALACGHMIACINIRLLIPARECKVPALRTAASLQGTLAPLVLENLNCTGKEERLVDCPVLQDDGTEYNGDAYIYNGDDGCDPLQATYAFVACSNTTGPGTRHGTYQALCSHKVN